jgi:hypothetical protein
MDADASTREPYGRNLTRLSADYGDFVILTIDGAHGWRAAMIAPEGVPGSGDGHAGAEISALTLDGLAARMDEARAAVIRLGKPGHEAKAPGYIS